MAAAIVWVGVVVAASWFVQAPVVDQQCATLSQSQASPASGIVHPAREAYRSTFTYTAGLCGVPTPGNQCTNGAQVRFEVVDKAPYANASFTPATTTAIGAPAGTVSATSSFELRLDATAPVNASFQVVVRGTCNGLAADRRFTLTVGPYVAVRASIVAARADSGVYEWTVRIENLGSSAARVRFAGNPSDGDHNWTLPAPIVVGRVGSQDPSPVARADVRLARPDLAINYSLSVRATPSGSDGPELDAWILPLAFTQFESRGSTPGAGVALSLVAVVCVLARRR